MKRNIFQGCNRLICCLLLLQTAFPPYWVHAASIPGFYGKANLPAPVAEALPQLRVAVEGISSVEQKSPAKLVVTQDKEKAIADWESFNVGQDAWVQFDQKGHTNWSVLNRIYDQNPSQIFGRLTADGKVFLINGNGILFSPESRVDVQGLVASSLKIAQDDFLDGVLNFSMDPDQKDADKACVSNHGKITTGELGSVFLVAPHVENYGTITTPAGQAGLVAGEKVALYANESTGNTRSALVVKVAENPGTALNGDTGKMITDTGLSGMYGREVTQNGVIRSVTAVKRNGSIELLATEKVTTGKVSITETPVSESDERVHESFKLQNGAITMDGLDAANPVNPQTPVNKIEIGGRVSAPSGTIVLKAADRVLMNSGSTVDVGGEWAEIAPEDTQVTAQLNSVELRDDYGQKDGELKGATITVNPLEGSNIGDLSTHLASRETTARERSTTGGTVEIWCKKGEIIVKDDATIDISGGGTRVMTGTVDSTKLKAGHSVVDISEAAEWTTYDTILGSHNVVSDRWGLIGAYDGLYYGGATPVKAAVPSYLEGADAGILKLIGKRIALDGRIEGSVTIGDYQVLDQEELNALGEVKTRGLARPHGGTVEFGMQPAGNTETINMVTDAVMLQQQVAKLPGNFAMADLLPPAPLGNGIDNDVSILPVETLNAAGLGALNIYANLSVEVAQGANLTLTAGGVLNAATRSFSNAGAIEVPSGFINIDIGDNVTSFSENIEYRVLEDRFVLKNGGLLSVAGEIRDMTLLVDSNDLPPVARVNGGSITVTDETLNGDSFYVEPNAVMDVSGGYAIDSSGKASAGSAGKLALEGNRMRIEGNLFGLGAGTKKGGELQIHTERIWLGPAGSAGSNDAGPEGCLILRDDFLKGTGFTNITLQSVFDLEVSQGASLMPSCDKLAVSAPGNLSGSKGGAPVFTNTLTVLPEDRSRVSSATLEKTSIQLNAGDAITATQENSSNLSEAAIKIAPYSRIEVLPEGSITLSAPAVEMAGTLTAMAGKISINATGLGGVVIYPFARLLAQGYNLTDDPVLAGGETTYTPLAGGSVTIRSATDLSIFPGALIDVSGAPPVDRMTGTLSGSVDSVAVAGDAGSVYLSTLKDLSLQGTMHAQAGLGSLAGGSFKIESKNLDTALIITPELLEMVTASGFDFLTLSSYHSLAFSDVINIAIDRKLVLDAPKMALSGSQSIRFNAPWISLQNTYWTTGATPDAGAAQLVLVGDWVDVTGSVAVSGAAQTVLQADQAVRFSDFYYQQSFGKKWAGDFLLSGDLLLSTSQAYVTTLSDVNVTAAGQVILRGTADLPSLPMVSAGGNLSIRGSDILIQNMMLGAPNGTISLETVGEGGRIQVTDGAILTTRGEEKVAYGLLDETNWYRFSKQVGKTDQTLSVTGAPTSGITLIADEVVVERNATIDFSGGGSIFAYGFLSGIEGSVNPFSKPGRYVIWPENSGCLPGPSVYLEGINGLPAGNYALLPEAYAFMDGAMVIEAVSASAVTGGHNTSGEGYPVVTGYDAYSGVPGHESKPRFFSVRSAADVRPEGHFNEVESIAGDAGNLVIAGQTTVLQGNFLGQGMEGFSGGRLALSGLEITIGKNAGVGLEDISFSDAIPDTLRNQFFMDVDAVSSGGIEALTLGKAGQTATVAIAADTVLDIPSLSIYATDAVRIGEGASIQGSGDGDLLISAGEGVLSLSPDTLIQGQGTIDLTMSEIELDGVIDLTDVALTLRSDSICLADESTALAGSGVLMVTEALWRDFNKTSSLELNADSGLFTAGNITIAAKKEIRIDAPLWAAWGDGPGSVTVSSGSISVKNSHGGSSPAFGPAGTASLTLIAENGIDIGNGSLSVSKYASVAMTAGDDIRFLGKGSLGVSGDFTLTSDRVTGGPVMQGDDYERAAFDITAGGILSLTGGDDGGVSDAGDSGALSFSAFSIYQTGMITLSGGTLDLKATGKGEAGGVTLGDGARIFAGGDGKLPGGTVSISSEYGGVLLSEGAVMDVSAGEQGDGGSILLSAGGGGVGIEGTLLGASAGGKGGEFYLETDKMAAEALSSLSRMLQDGGFTHTVDMSVSAGDLVISSDTLISADSIRISSDTGSISSYGILESEDSAGTIALHGQTGVVLNSGAIIRHAGTHDDEGVQAITLSARSGGVLLNEGSRVIFEPSAAGNGGGLYIRAPLAGSDRTIDARLQGKVEGADVITIEGVKTYDRADVTTALLASLAQETAGFVNASSSMAGAVFGSGSTGAADQHIIPGIEIFHNGTIRIESDIDLGALGQAGALTVRAAGDLLVNGHLDHHSSRGGNGATGWNISLAAGADLSGADPLSTGNAGGNLIVGSGAYLYTQLGSIRFASGGDVSVTGTDSRMATDSGNITGKVSGNLLLDGAAIESAGGDVSLRIDGNLIFEKEKGLSGAVRTLGNAQTEEDDAYWAYSGGGDIEVYVGGEIRSVVNKNAWDRVYTKRITDADGNRITKTFWAASYNTGDGEEITQGIATMGGGDLTIRCAGDGYLAAGAFQEGDVSLYFGGNLDGRFLVREGNAQLVSGGSFGLLTGSQIEMFDASVDLFAAGQMTIGAMVNPSLSRPGLFSGNNDWNMTYGRNSSIDLSTRSGDIRLTGQSPFYSLTIEQKLRATILPSNLSIRAGNDVRIENWFAMAPSENGQLRIIAGGDIDGAYDDSRGNLKHGTIHMSDLNPDSVFGDHSGSKGPNGFAIDYLNIFFNPFGHAAQVLHGGDATPALICAAGDIRDVKLSLPKAADITAGGDIRDIQYMGQNANPTDVTRITAGGSLIFDPLYTVNLDTLFSPGIEQGGSGQFLVQAGENMDLGRSNGIAAVGNLYNQALQDQGCELDVVAGFSGDFLSSAVNSFFTGLLEKGNEYSESLAKGDKTAAQAAVDAARALIGEALSGYRSEDPATGSIDMVHSKIYSSSEEGKLQMITGGKINVGRSTLNEDSTQATGIYTTSGAEIRIFTAGDLNVNESKVMTYRGGNIMVWSDRGDINAGRGAKTSISVDPPKITYLDDGTAVLKFNPPAVGSGIRTLTYDPDGAEGPDAEPEAGDVYLFAPEGIIDAGEAGISGKKVILAATEVVNAQNIDFALGSVGVPDTGGAAASFGALAGAGTVTEAGKMSESASAIGDSQERFSKNLQAMADSLVPKWLAVEVIGFVEEEDSGEKQKDVKEHKAQSEKKEGEK